MNKYLRRRSVKVKTSKVLTIGILLCIWALFMTWIPQYSSSKTVYVPRSEDTYKRNDYGDLKSIERYSWTDKYSFGSSEGGYTGFRVASGALGLLAFAALAYSLINLHYSFTFKMPHWTRNLPIICFLYLVIFWVLGFIKVIYYFHFGLGGITFLIGLILLYKGKAYAL